MSTSQSNPAQLAAEQSAAYNQTAMKAMASGDLAGAESALMRAIGLDRRNVPAWLNLAAIRRQRNDLDAAFAAIQEVLQLDARNFPALLMSATMLEREGRAVPAALAYSAALANAPPDARMDAATLQVVKRGRAVQEAYTKQLGEHVRASVAVAADQCSGTERRRLESFIDTTVRVRRRYRQEPTDYCYPGLPAIEFYDRAEFPWLEEFESRTPAIAQELADILREDAGGFAPYIRYSPHMPLDQWAELNHSPRWTSFEFYDKGVVIADRARRAPATIEAVSRLPQADVALRSPCAMYSALQPKTRIPPHTGVANFRLVVHLPLVIPPGCGFRVGGETREWRIGEAWVFDDTIEHEAWNESDQARYVFICDIWSPRFSPTERAAIAAVISATDAFNGTVPAAHV